MFALLLTAALAAPWLPTPYTAAQIRDAMPVGSSLILVVTDPESVAQVSWTVTASSRRAVTIQYLILDAAGQPISNPEVSSDRWSVLRKHARFPADSSSRQRATFESPWGPLDGWRYTVTRPDGVSLYDFADLLPGPPLRMVTTADGVVTKSMEILKRDPPPR